MSISPTKFSINMFDLDTHAEIHTKCSINMFDLDTHAEIHTKADENITWRS